MSYSDGEIPVAAMARCRDALSSAFRWRQKLGNTVGRQSIVVVRLGEGSFQSEQHVARSTEKFRGWGEA
jgi:hypothetical protein